LFAGARILGIEEREIGTKWTNENGVHFTMIFNTFVMMQVFNEINSRKIGEFEYNVFEGFFNNTLFIFIEVLTIVVQIVLVEIGGEAVKTSHLTYQQHGICIGIGAFSIVVGFMIKLLPKRIFSFTIDQTPMDEVEASKSISKILRKSTNALQRKLTRVGSEKNMSRTEMGQMKAYKSMKTFKY
jgi:Ca2+ transporting ATPase